MAKYITRAQLMAQHEADQARIAGLMVENKTLARRAKELGDELAVAQRSITALKHQVDGMATTQPVALGAKALMAEAKRLATQGTPCYVRGHHIYDAKSREVLV